MINKNYNKIHINPNTGVTSRCKAKAEKCPFSSSDEHYSRF